MRLQTQPPCDRQREADNNKEKWRVHALLVKQILNCVINFFQMKIFKQKGFSIILRVRKTNQLICLRWYCVNCENSTLFKGFTKQFHVLFEREVSWISDIRTSSTRLISRILLEWEDEGRVWHLIVTCNFCTKLWLEPGAAITLSERVRKWRQSSSVAMDQRKGPGIRRSMSFSHGE